MFVNAEASRIKFHISANRFLSKMIRIIMGRLLEIGRGELSLYQFEYFLANKQTPAIITPAYPQGLYLSKVTYPYLDIPPATLFSAGCQNINDADWRAIQV